MYFLFTHQMLSMKIYFLSFLCVCDHLQNTVSIPLCQAWKGTKFHFLTEQDTVQVKFTCSICMGEPLSQETVERATSQATFFGPTCTVTKQLVISMTEENLNKTYLIL